MASPMVHHTNAWLKPSIKTALVVGSLLTVINQSDRIRSGPWNFELAVRIAGNLLVPFCVSAYSRYSAQRTATPSDSGNFEA
ncbi:MAG: hypothetical protein IBJ19_00505 [Gemmatimonadaceae bacterium]|nr:hypothetical protein [Gemmatimonadaceae bacterium]